MAISAADVKKLRDVTGAGMMDCKKALTEANGDFAQAEKILKEMGLAAVAKRQDRATENGRVFVKTGNGKAVVLSLSCETDFVAQNKDFAKLGDDLCTVILEKGYTEINSELEEMVNALIAITSKNVEALSPLEMSHSGMVITEFSTTTPKNPKANHGICRLRLAPLCVEAKSSGTIRSTGISKSTRIILIITAIFSASGEIPLPAPPTFATSCIVSPTYSPI